MLGSRWFLEFTTDKEASLHYIEEILHTSETAYQRLEIMKLGSYGKALILDGKLQSAESDEFIYHEALVHPALVTHGQPEKVLIAGGGEGATIRECLRYPTIKKVVMVDLDGEVVEACKVHLQEWHRGAFDDPRVEVYYDDARRFIRESDEQYDVIILDLPEPMEEGPAIMLYTSEFYKEVSDHLLPGGVMVTQATTVSTNNYQAYSIIHNTIETVFPIVKGYWTSVPSFFVPWGFIFASGEKDPLSMDDMELERRISSISGDLGFYNQQIHRSVFSLPNYLQTALEEETRINSDNAPLSFY